jgi:hypothetical protein
MIICYSLSNSQALSIPKGWRVSGKTGEEAAVDYFAAEITQQGDSEQPYYGADHLYNLRHTPQR